MLSGLADSCWHGRDLFARGNPQRRIVDDASGERVMQPVDTEYPQLHNTG